MLEIYEHWDEKLINVIRKPLNVTQQHYLPKKRFMQSIFVCKKKVNRLLQLVIDFVQKLAVYSNW